MVRGSSCRLLDGPDDRLLVPGTILFTPTECLTTESSPESDFFLALEYILSVDRYTLSGFPERAINSGCQVR